jgi:hypothetical protein
MFFAALFVRSLLLAGLAASNQRATGITFSRRGLREGLVASVVFGWIAGTVWYLIRRR